MFVSRFGCIHARLTRHGAARFELGDAGALGERDNMAEYRIVAQEARKILMAWGTRLTPSFGATEACTWLMRLAVARLLAVFRGTKTTFSMTAFGKCVRDWASHPLFGVNKAEWGKLEKAECGQVFREVWSLLNELGDDVRQVGWLYQYFHAPEHEAVIDVIGKRPVATDDIPAATQIFTPDWIAEYLVQDALEYAKCGRTNLDKLTFCDPCVGCGHLLISAFEAFLAAYQKLGFEPNECVEHIVKTQLFGLDIDQTVIDIVDLCLRLCVVKHCPQISMLDVKTNVLAIQDQTWLDDVVLPKKLVKKKELLRHASLYGSLIDLNEDELAALDEAFRALPLDLVSKSAFLDISNQWQNAKTAFGWMNRRFNVVCTNPPYLNKLLPETKAFLRKRFPGYSKDLFAAFVKRDSELCVGDGACGFMTPNVWLSIKNYVDMRKDVLMHHPPISLVRLAKNAYFSEASVDLCAFVLKNQPSDEPGTYYNLEGTRQMMEAQEAAFAELRKTGQNAECTRVRPSEILKSPDYLFSFCWASDDIGQLFDRFPKLGEFGTPRQGLATTDNDVYLRHWFELRRDRVVFDMRSCEEAKASGGTWFPYNKGGEYCKWFGNQTYLVNYQNDGEAIKNSVMEHYPYLKTPDFVVKNTRFYFRPCVSWTKVSSSRTSFRYYPAGFIFDVAGGCLFMDNEADLLYAIGFLNTELCARLLAHISPTMNYEMGHIASLPFVQMPEPQRAEVVECARQAIDLAQQQWDDLEISWHFSVHPAYRTTTSNLSGALTSWRERRSTLARALKACEDRLETLFCEAAGVEVQPCVIKAPRTETFSPDHEVLSIFSYVFGQIFGRFGATARVSWVILSTDDALNASGVSVVQNWLKEHRTEGTDADDDQSICECLNPAHHEAPEHPGLCRIARDLYKYHTRICDHRPLIWLVDPRHTGLRVFVDYWSLKTLDWHQLATSVEGSITSKTSDESADKIRRIAQGLRDAAVCAKKVDFERGVKVNHALFGDLFAKL